MSQRLLTAIVKVRSVGQGRQIESDVEATMRLLFFEICKRGISVILLDDCWNIKRKGD